MIKKTVVMPITALLLLAGCSSNSGPSSSDYRLPILNGETEQFCLTSERQVRVSDLMLNDGLLLQRSNTQIHAARYHRWSGSLEQQLQQSVQRRLTDNNCQGRLLITVMDFYGDNQGHAVVSGHWRYQAPSEEMVTDAFYYQQALSTDGYDALVEALNSAWARALTDIRQQLPK